jgi:ribulose-5-phosphate 4-epimerase/fuculose-1-phosphate aldolase
MTTGEPGDPGDVLIKTALAWRGLGRLGLLDTIFNHISHSWIDSDNSLQLTMTPTGLLPAEVFPEGLKTFPLREYLPFESETLGVNADGLRLHSHLQMVRGRPGVIIHTHSRHGIAVGAADCGLLPISQTAIELLPDLRVVEYQGMLRNVCADAGLIEMACSGGIALLQNHGSLVVADNIEEAFYLTYFLEEACHIQVLALSQAHRLVSPSTEAILSAQQTLRLTRALDARSLFRALCSDHTQGT